MSRHFGEATDGGAVMNSTVFQLGAAVFMFGPAAYALTKWSKPDDEDGIKPPVSSDKIAMALLWTAVMLGIVIFNWRHEVHQVKRVCDTLEAKIELRQMADDRFDATTEEEWWAICHPDDKPDTGE